MGKSKSLSIGKVLDILKCCLIGLLITLVGVITLAVILSFVDISSGFLSYINNAIKGASIFMLVFFLARREKDKLLIRATIASMIYGVLTFVIFSMLNKGFSINMSILYDLLFAVIVAIISSIIIKLIVRKN